MGLASEGDALRSGYPVYLNVAGQRFEGEERIFLTEDLLAALRQGGRAFIEWTTLDGRTHEKTFELQGFSAAYDKCMAFLDGMATPK